MKKGLLLTVFVVILLQAACNGGKGEAGNMTPVKEKVDNYIYDIIETKYDFDKDIDISIPTVYIRGNYLYFTAYGTDAYPLKKDNENGYHMCRYDIANDEFVILYDGFDDGATFGALYVTENEDIVMLKYYSEWNEEKSVSEIRIAKVIYGNDGTAKENIVISEPGIDTNDMTYVNIRECKFDDKGNIYVVYEYNATDSFSYDICMYDAKGILKNRVSMRDKLFYSMVIDNEDRAVVCYGGAVNNSEYCECMYLDFENGKPGETLKGLSMGDSIFSRCEIIDSYGDIPFFISDGTVLYTYDKEKGQPEALLNFMNTGILYNDLYYINQLDDGRLFCIAGDYMGFLDKNDSASDERKVLKIASLKNSGDIDVQRMIIDYNQSNTEYRIEYTSYDETRKSPQEAMMMDIAAGYAPDILLLGVQNVNLLANRGLLCDLTPYIKEDDTVNEDYFVDGILSATEISGKQYYVIDAFSIDTIIGRKSELKDLENDWTADKLIDYYSLRRDDMMFCAHNTKTGVADMLIYNDTDRYIDWRKGKCSFDGKEFKKVLEFCNGFTDNDYSDDISEFELINKGKVLLGSPSGMGIDRLSNIQAYNKVYQGDEMYLGYPDSGCRAYISTWAYGNRCGIVPSSKYKDEAWNFIKELLLMNKDTNYMEYGGFPTSKAEFDELMEICMQDFYKTENGDKISNYYSGGYSGYQVTTGPATEEEVQLLRDLINNSKAHESGYGGVKYIIEDDIQEYFDGKRSLDDTVRIIQDRMQKYVNENR